MKNIFNIFNTRKNKKKRFSLLEVLAAITLMVIVSTALMTNFKKSFEKGRAFKTKEGCRQVHRALTFAACEENKSYEEVVDDWENVIIGSPLVSKKSSSNDPTKDGWGEKYEVQEQDGSIVVRSKKYEEHLNRTNIKTDSEDEDNYWE